jgi:hypothetical protein
VLLLLACYVKSIGFLRPIEGKTATLLVLHQDWFDGFSVTVVLRNKAQLAGNGLSPCQKLQRSGGAPQQRPKGWPVSAHGGVTPLAKD